MRAVVATEFGSTDVLEVQQVPSPELGATDVRIKVEAAGLNFADVMARLGEYPHSSTVPFVGGFEASGVVTEVGPQVSGFRPGDRVTGVTRTGAFAEEISIDQRDVIAIPDAMSFAEGAAVPITYMTAWAGLIGYGHVKPGERVLIKAAAGGVGLAAVQLAKDAGAEVYGAASPSKHAAIVAAGVDVPLDYTTPGWDDDLPTFDVVMDAIGGESFRRSYDSLRPGGRLCAFGAVSVFNGGTRESADGEEPLDFRLVGGLSSLEQMVHSKTIIGLDIRVLWDDRGSLEEWLAPLVPLLERKVIAPIVAEQVPFDEAARAHQMLVDRSNIGKVVLVP